MSASPNLRPVIDMGCNPLTLAVALSLDEVQQTSLAETLGAFCRACTRSKPPGPRTAPDPGGTGAASLSPRASTTGPAGVIDFGGLGIGDRSVDLLYAWSLLEAPARDTLRIASGSDEATWARARAWAFVGPGLLTLASCRHTMPVRTERLTAMVEAVAAEVGVQLR